jgi:hypothetical protein
MESNSRGRRKGWKAEELGDPSKFQVERTVNIPQYVRAMTAPSTPQSGQAQDQILHLFRIISALYPHLQK